MDEPLPINTIRGKGWGNFQTHGNKELQELEERGAKHVAQVTETVSWLSGH